MLIIRGKEGKKNPCIYLLLAEGCNGSQYRPDTERPDNDQTCRSHNERASKSESKLFHESQVCCSFATSAVLSNI